MFQSYYEEKRKKRIGLFPSWNNIFFVDWWQEITVKCNPEPGFKYSNEIQFWVAARSAPDPLVRCAMVSAFASSHAWVGTWS